MARRCIWIRCAARLRVTIFSSPPCSSWAAYCMRRSVMTSIGVRPPLGQLTLSLALSTRATTGPLRPSAIVGGTSTFSSHLQGHHNPSATVGPPHDVVNTLLNARVLAPRPQEQHKSPLRCTLYRRVPLTSALTQDTSELAPKIGVRFFSRREAFAKEGSACRACHRRLGRR